MHIIHHPLIFLQQYCCNVDFVQHKYGKPVFQYYNI